MLIRPMLPCGGVESSALCLSWAGFFGSALTVQICSLIDGLEAIELLKKQHFEAVITDIKMPEVDGLSLAKYIADNFPDIIVIIISGYNDFEYARSAIQYRVTDYLLKPLVDQNLILLLESIARRLEKQPASDYKVSYSQSLRRCPAEAGSGADDLLSRQMPCGSLTAVQECPAGISTVHGGWSLSYPAIMISSMPDLPFSTG